MLVLSALVMVVGSWSFYDTSGPLPEPDKSRLVQQAQKKVVADLIADSEHFKEQVTKAAKAYKVADFDYQSLKKGNVLVTEFSGDQELKKKAPLETDHLKLQVLTKQVEVGEEGTSLRMPHLSLSITNKTEKFLAYMVKTEVDGECKPKGALAHNAIALKPSETLVRTECLPRKKASLHIKKVSVMEISPLGYHFVSRLDPQSLQYEARTYAGHLLNPNFSQCKLPLPWRRVQAAIRNGTKWHDIIDFYSRHSCDEYSFFSEYRRTDKGPKSLPVLPE